MKTVAAVFPTLIEAAGACRDLEHIGVPRDDINLIAGNDARRHDEYVEKVTKATIPTETAAAAGASMGGGLGILAMLGALAIPGVGPVLALGPMLTIFAAGGIGAATGGLIGAFHEMGIPKEWAPLYEEAVKRGAIVVGAIVDDRFEVGAVYALVRNGGHEIKDAQDPWTGADWSGPRHDPHPYVSVSTIGEQNG
jgi:hypothetical protein